MKPAWKETGDRFLLSGLPKASVCTFKRWLDLPAGACAASDLRGWSQRAGLNAKGIVGMGQVHGGRIEKVASPGDRVFPSCDGLVTDQPGLALVVRSADCLPVICHVPHRDFLGVAHAGWRGVRKGVLFELVRALGSSFEVWAAIGPGIGPCCYEVGPEFKGYFPAFVRSREGKWFFDLPGAARHQLVQAGVREEAIISAPWCSACHPDCRSSRREGAQAGRMVTVALLSGGW